MEDKQQHEAHFDREQRRQADETVRKIRKLLRDLDWGNRQIREIADEVWEWQPCRSRN